MSSNMDLKRLKRPNWSTTFGFNCVPASETKAVDQLFGAKAVVLRLAEDPFEPLPATLRRKVKRACTYICLAYT